jgi:lipopolysaccharide export system permease protein
MIIATVVVKEAADFVVKYQLPAVMFFKIIGLASPQFIVLAIPMGVLLGTLLAVGRLSTDLEITALRSCGVSLYRIIMPFFAIGLLLSAVTFIGAERIVPYTNTQLKELKNSVLSQGLLRQRRVSWPIYEKGELRWNLIASEIDGYILRDVKLNYYDPYDALDDFYVIADYAEWIGNSWTFYNMRLTKLRPGDEPMVAYFNEYIVPDFEITPESLSLLKKQEAEDLTTIQLRKLIDQLSTDLATSGTASNPREATQPEATPDQTHPTSRELQDKRILTLQTKLHFKYAIPLTPFFFIFIAVPLAILPIRSTRTIGMGIALLGVLFYYTMYAFCINLGSVGAVPPVVAAWIPNSVLLLMGLVLLRIRDRN